LSISRRHAAALPTAAAVAGLLLSLSGCKLLQDLGLKDAPPKPAPSSTGIASATPEPSASATADIAAEPFDPKTFAEISPLCENARIPVLMYHDIVKRRGLPGGVYFDCTKDEFAQQLQWLHDQGATAISLDQLHRHLTRGEAVPEKAVVLTFDDNYQGFFDYAYPILKQYKWPAAMFVHTNFVGDKKGAHPKMTWEELKQLDSEGLVTIGSHTMSHPEDISKLPIDEQEHELSGSKSELEDHLGHPIPYFCYPDGKGDTATFDAVKGAGYTMAFTMDNGPAEESPGILRINRYIQTRMEKAWTDSQAAIVNAPATVVDQNIAAAPVTLQVADFAGTKLGLVKGGQPQTAQDPGGSRKSVGEFIQMTPGTVAGMNGTFFANAWLRGTDNTMIGPCLTTAEKTFRPETDPTRLAKLLDRPLVLWNASRLMIVPFNPATMNDEVSLRTLMPDMTDCFLAGAWIVHGGVARTREQMQAYSARDFNDPRRRAFFGITADGQVVLGGSLEVITTEKLAEAAAAAGVQEAVLMDSGFSTSIVYDNKIIVTGHTAANLPSRPVPHSILVSGTLEQPTDPETQAALQKGDPAVGTVSAVDAETGIASAPGSGSGTGHHRRRRHRTSH